MSRSAKYVILSALAILSLGIFLKGAKAPGSNTWIAAGTMSSSRTAACSALLPDGRVLVSGGSGSAGVLATAEFFNVDGSFTSAAPMMYPRSAHSCAALADGRVLVAGGRNNGGSLDVAEIYDPATNRWQTIPGLLTARSGHTTSQLPDGRIVFAGGESAGVALATLEIFDPATGAFAPIPSLLSSPRTGHSAAVLKNGRVLIAGGSSGERVLDTADLFDPYTATVIPAGKLLSPRTGHTATTQLDGRVFLAGGNDGQTDLALTETFDPATGAFTPAGAMSTPRRGHLALRIPNNNSILLAGGSSNGTPLASTELFIPWTGAFRGADDLTAARLGATGSGMKRPGAVMLAGGPVNASGEIYVGETVMTDKADYRPGEHVVITGTGWQPGETVKLSFVESPLIDTHPDLFAVADAGGNIYNNQFVPDIYDVNVTFTLTATGLTSGLTAQATFTDASKNYKATIGPTSDTAGSTTSYTITITECGGGNCGSGNDSGSGNQIGSAFATVPSGYTVTAAAITAATVTAPAGKSWSKGLSGSQIQLWASTGASKLDAGQSVSITFSATAACPSTSPTSYTWATDAGSSIPSIPSPAIGTDFDRIGLDPSVSVSGACDATPPTVSSIVRQVGSSNPTNAASVNFTVTFSESVTGVNLADFALVTTGAFTVAPSITLVSADTGSTRTVTVNTGTGDGTIGLNLNDDDSIIDGAGNKLGGTGTGTVATLPSAGNGSFAGDVYTIDRTTPTSTIGFPLDGAYYNTAGWEAGCTTPGVGDICGTATDPTAGTVSSGVQKVEVSIKRLSDNTYWNGASFVGGSELFNNATLALPNWSLMLAAANLTDGVSYTVHARSTDVAGNVEASPTATFTYDITPPTVVSIVKTGTSPTNASSVGYTVTFTESVTGVDTGDFALTKAGTINGGAAVSTVSAGPGNTRTVTVNTGTGDGTIRLDLNDNDTIVDAAGNTLAGTGTGTVATLPSAGNGSFAGDVYMIDRTAPTSTIGFPLDGAYYNTAGWEAGCTPGVGDICGTATDPTVGTVSSGVQKVEVSIKRLSDNTYWNGASFVGGSELFNNATLALPNWSLMLAAANLTDNVSYTVHARSTDVAGNVEAGPTATFTYDITPPTVVSIVKTGTSPTNASSVGYTVTFTESVTGVDAGDFALTKTGTINGGAAVSTVSAGPGNTRTVTVNTGTGDGTIRLDLNDNDTIMDLAGNTLAGTGTGTVATLPSAGNGSFAGEVYTIDRTAPTSTIAFPIGGAFYNNAGWNSGCSTAAGDSCGGSNDPLTGGVSSGVNKVEVSIKSNFNGMWWGGASFNSASEVFYTATGTNPWNLPFAAANFPDGSFTIHTKATDNAGNVEASPMVTFSIDNTPPTSAITFPTPSFYSSATWNAGCATPAGDMCGAAADPIVNLVASGILNVKLSVKQNSTGNYWDGFGFNSATEVFSTATGTTLWNLVFAFANLAAPGSYTVHTLAIDGAGNMELVGPTVTFNTASDVANIQVIAASHSVGSGSSPGTTKSALPLLLEVYDKATFPSMDPKNFATIWTTTGTDLATTVPPKAAISGPSLITHGGGPANLYTILVPAATPANNAAFGTSGEYLIIGKGVVNSTDVYPGSPTDLLPPGSTTQKYLQAGVNGVGKIFPMKTTSIPGSLLLIAEPEYIEFTTDTELVPIIYESVDGAWSSVVTAEPPEGFVANPGAISVTVDTSLETAAQFTIKDVGSAWTNTKLTHRILHKGKQTTIVSTPGMINSQKGQKGNKP